MLSSIVGPVDYAAATVLVFAFICSCVIITSLIIKRRSRTDIANEFYLAKMKQEAENARAQYSIETERAYKFKQLDKNLITSHREGA